MFTKRDTHTLLSVLPFKAIIGKFRNKQKEQTNSKMFITQRDTHTLLPVLSFKKKKKEEKEKQRPIKKKKKIH